MTISNISFFSFISSVCAISKSCHLVQLKTAWLLWEMFSHNVAICHVVDALDEALDGEKR